MLLLMRRMLLLLTCSPMLLLLAYAAAIRYAAMLYALPSMILFAASCCRFSPMIDAFTIFFAFRRHFSSSSLILPPPFSILMPLRRFRRRYAAAFSLRFHC